MRYLPKMVNYVYKEENEFATRKQEALNVRLKWKDRIPVICERASYTGMLIVAQLGVAPQPLH